MDSHQIKGYCKEALTIFDQRGGRQAMGFLIGDKFYQKYKELKNAQNKLKFLYPEKKMTRKHPLSLGGRSFKLSYALTLNDNYSEYLEKVEYLENVLEIFASEINEAFDANDIQDYLNSYPRLGRKNQSSYVIDNDPNLNQEIWMTPEDILSEVRDILTVEELKNQFF